MRETTIQDKYEIILNATYETDVPAAVIVAEPKSFSLPAMQPGDVFNAEVRFTNYGLIRADNIELKLPLDDQYFDYSALAAIPTSLSAKQSITVPVRLVCKKSLSPSGTASGAGSSIEAVGSKAVAVGSNAGATGAGCVTYTNCISLGYSWVCVNGTWQRQEEYACFTGVEGECEAGGAILYDGIASGNIWVPGAGATSGSMASPTPIALEDSLCAGQERFCAVDDECCRAPQNQELKSLVSLIGRGYEDDVTDMSIKAPGFQVNVMRRYYDNAWHLDSDSQNLEIVYGPDGITLDFIKKDRVKYIKTDNSGTVYAFGNKRFIFVKEGGFRWQNKSGKWTEYDTKGRLLYYGNKNNVKVTLIYADGENGKLIGLKDNNGRQVLWYEYNQDGKLSIVRDHTGREVKYFYDSSGKLFQVVDVLGNTTSFFYDSDGKLIKEREAGGLVKDIAYTEFKHVKSVAYGNGSSVSFDYAFNAGKQEYYARVLFSSGKTIERWYDRLGRRIRIVINGQEIERVTFDGRNKTIIDAAGNQAFEEYNEWDSLTKRTYPDGTSVSYEYEPNFQNVTRTVNEKGVVTNYAYDGQGNLIKAIEAVGTDCEKTAEYTYDSQGNVISITNPLGHTTTYEYDINSNLVKIIDALGNTTTYAYDTRGNRVSQTDANTNITQYTYDLTDRLSSVNDALDHTTTYAYDANGNNVSISYPDGNTTRFTYDVFNRLIRVIASQPAAGEAIYTYDSDDKLLTTTDANGNTTAYGYDNMSRMNKVTDSQGNVTSYAYDIIGNLVSITDAEGHTTNNTYDNLGRLTKITDPSGFTTQYSYDAGGNLTKKTDANNQTTEYEYDVVNQLTKIYYGGKNSPVKTVNFSYNKLGNMLTWDDSVYSASYIYDGLSRISQVTQNYPFGARMINYEYDKVGNRSAIARSDSDEVIYTYDALNRLIQVTSHTSQVTSYNYDNMSRLTKKTRPNGVYTDYTYDNLNRLTSLINKKSSGETVSSFAYTHDRVGNRLTMDVVRLSSPQEGTHNYVYDDIYRLTNAAHPTGFPESYTYDKVGNRKTSRDYPTWTYDTNNRLTSYNGTSFTYDNSGNTLSKTNAGQTTTYSYDYENRLSSIENLVSSIQYSYDPFGRRLSKTVDGVTKYYLYDNEDIIAEYDSSGNLIASYIHGQGIDDPISMTLGSNTYYYTFDGLGSVRELTDSGQNIVEAYKYDAFGNLETPPGTGNPYTYTSREYDSETGLYFYRARYYDAGVGRFLQQDPLLHLMTVMRRNNWFVPKFIYVPKLFHVYAYSFNSPINHVDPFGLAPFSWWDFTSWNSTNYCGMTKSGPGSIRSCYDDCCNGHDECLKKSKYHFWDITCSKVWECHGTLLNCWNACFMLDLIKAAEASLL